MTTFDVLVIGGGIAGASLACELANDRAVCLVDMEPSLGFHTTGRSVATFLESYGSPTIRSLTSASRPFLTAPPDGFDRGMLKPRPLLQFAAPGDEERVRALHREVIAHVPDVMIIDSALACEMCPVLRPQAVGLALVEPRAQEIDVHALHHGYVRKLRRNKGVVATDAGVVEMTRSNGMWQVVSAGGEIRSAPVVVNAAGAWADRIAVLAGVSAVGLQPLDRSIFQAGRVDAVAGSRMPFVGNMEGTLLSPKGNSSCAHRQMKLPRNPAMQSPTCWRSPGPSTRSTNARLWAFEACKPAGPVSAASSPTETPWWDSTPGPTGSPGTPGKADMGSRSLPRSRSSPRRSSAGTPWGQR